MSADTSITFDDRRGPRDPAPSALRLCYPLLAPPFVWAFQLMLNFAMSSHACFPFGASRADFLPGWEREWQWALAVNIICALASALGLLLSGSLWLSLRRGSRVGKDDVLRVLILSGALISALFTVAILFNTIYLGILSSCSRV